MNGTATPPASLFWVVCGPPAGDTIEKASLVVRNARIYTANPARPWADALACAGTNIVRVGTESQVDRLAASATAVIDAGGRLVLPGFIDAHVHLVWGYELGRWIDLTGRPSLEQALRRVASYARSHPEESILLGHGFDYAALVPGGLPTKEDLDAVAPDRPVLLTAWDGHTGWGNTRFVERALAAMEAVGTKVGEMERDPRTGAPTGIFRRAFDVTPLLPEVQARRSVDGLRRTVAMASAVGITTAFDVQVNLADLHAYDGLWREGALTVRIRAAIYHPEGTPEARYREFLAAASKYRDDWFRVAAVKLYIDGVQETGTAALLEPYANNPASVGETVYAEEEYGRIVGELDRLGFQVCTHACGDRGVRIALDAYEVAARTNGTSDRRHRIEHCENLSPVDIPRFARLGVVPCMMPRHASPELTGRWREAVGPERTRIAFPWRELVDAGAALSFASDWPVAEVDPLVGISEAVNRLTPDDSPSPHRLSIREAVDGYTRRAAFACHAESNRGILAEGHYADLLVLSHDLFEIPPERIREARVVRTIVGGKTVHSDAAAG